MPITSSLSSLANAAFDTARANLRSMAEAAAAPPAPAAEKPAADQPAAETAEAPKRVQGQRQGVSLDAYA
ncbi:hypothetical protein [Actinoplanes sp. URMC 104]|uniref:hypothetical protein n=1 Tax=Actinoplanes sp. URMC 104 TaxID=3423409 RepID=UPI003F1D3DD3